MRFADVSAGHITQKDADLLKYYSIPFTERPDTREIFAGPIVYGYPEGFFVCSGVPNDEVADYIKECKDVGMSKQFCQILKEAAKQSMSFVRFDCDGAHVKGLKEFNW